MRLVQQYGHLQKQAEKQTERQTDRDARRQTDRGRQTETQAGRQTDRGRETELFKERERELLHKDKDSFGSFVVVVNRYVPDNKNSNTQCSKQEYK